MKPKLGTYFEKNSLLRIMDRAGINNALVYHALSKECSPCDGNREILESVEKEKRLFPVFTLVPHHTGEVENPRQFISKAIAKGVRSIRVFPSLMHYFSLKDYSFREALAEMEKRKMPFMIGAGELPWDEIDEMCNRHPGLRLIVMEADYDAARFLYPLLKRHPNIYIEISNYRGHRAIRDISERFGAERVIFGTCLPFYNPGVAISLLMYSGLRQKEKEMIASKNIERLIKEVK